MSDGLSDLAKTYLEYQDDIRRGRAALKTDVASALEEAKKRIESDTDADVEVKKNRLIQELTWDVGDYTLKVELELSWKAENQWTPAARLQLQYPKNKANYALHGGDKLATTLSDQTQWKDKVTLVSANVERKGKILSDSLIEQPVDTLVECWNTAQETTRELHADLQAAFGSALTFIERLDTIAVQEAATLRKLGLIRGRKSDQPTPWKIGGSLPPYYQWKHRVEQRDRDYLYDLFLVGTDAPRLLWTIWRGGEDERFQHLLEEEEFRGKPVLLDASEYLKMIEVDGDDDRVELLARQLFDEMISILRNCFEK